MDKKIKKFVLIKIVMLLGIKFYVLNLLKNIIEIIKEKVNKCVYFVKKNMFYFKLLYLV